MLLKYNTFDKSKSGILPLYIKGMIVLWLTLAERGKKIKQMAIYLFCNDTVKHLVKDINLSCRNKQLHSIEFNALIVNMCNVFA